MARRPDSASDPRSPPCISLKIVPCATSTSAQAIPLSSDRLPCKDHRHGTLRHGLRGDRGTQPRSSRVHFCSTLSLCSLVPSEWVKPPSDAPGKVDSSKDCAPPSALIPRGKAQSSEQSPRCGLRHCKRVAVWLHGARGSFQGADERARRGTQDGPCKP